jgi:hypothetical protein
MAKDNREHQRHSRIRKQKHIQQLQDEVRQCQNLSEDLSRELQRVARCVADENTKLRKLLYPHGLEKVELEGPIHRHYVQFEMPPAGSTHDDQEYNPIDNTPAISGRLYELNLKTHKPREEVPKLELDSETLDMEHVSSNTQEDHVNCFKASKCRATSCQQALDIISTARADMDVESVRAELGCEEDMECRVENIKIFDLLDA